MLYGIPMRYEKILVLLPEHKWANKLANFNLLQNSIAKELGLENE